MSELGSKKETQARFFEQLLQTLQMTLNDRDLKSLESLFQHGASMSRRVLDGKEGPIDPSWK